MRGLRLLGLLVAVGLVAAGCGESKQTTAEVRDARAYRPGLFSIFPASEGRRSCQIPFGVFGGTARGHTPGTCQTGVSSVRAYDSDGYIGDQKVAIVSFTARWHWGGSSGKAMPDPRHTWWVLEQPGPPVRVLGSCELQPSWPSGSESEGILDPCKSPSPFGRRTRETPLRAAFAAQGIELTSDHQPGWPHGTIGLRAPGKAYVEMQLRQPSVVMRPPGRLANMQYGFWRQGNVEVWFNRNDQAQITRALRALRCEGSETICRRNPAVSPPALQAVNRCLAAHQLSIFRETRDQPYEGSGDDPGNRTVKRIEYISYTSPSPGNDAGEVVLFSTTHDAQNYAAYWRRASRSQVGFAPASRRAGATNHIAWVRDSTPWAPAKIVATCVREHA